MATLLHLDSAIMPDGASASRAVTAAFADAWREAHPGGKVIHRDLAVEPVPHLDAVTVTAGYAAPADRSEAQAAAYAARVALIEEVEDADAVVIGVPMYNFTVPSTVKTWLDHLIMAGRTFGEGTQSLAGKPVVIVASRGGSYEPGAPRAPYEYVKTFLADAFDQYFAIKPEFITVDLTLAATVPAMAELKPLAEAARAKALADAETRGRELAKHLGDGA
jgi:FMN-dependent NADH-azoreductase